MNAPSIQWKDDNGTFSRSKLCGARGFEKTGLRCSLRRLEPGSSSFHYAFGTGLVFYSNLSMYYFEPFNSSFATTKKTKLFFQTPFATGPEDSPEDILRRFEIKSVLLSSWIEEHWLFCYSIFINTSTTSTTGLARASTALTQATGRLYLHLQRYGITLLCSFFFCFSTLV